MADYRLTQLAKKTAFSHGADMVGVGNIERWADAPILMSPQGIFPEAKSVIVCAIHHTDAMIEIGGEGSPHEQGSYAFQYHMNNQLDVISYSMGRFLEKQGYRAVPITASNIWRYREYKSLKSTFAPDMSHIYASVCAGLTELGYHGISMSPEYGPRNRLVSIITDAPLVPDPLLEGDTLCDDCGQCLKHCCAWATTQEVDGTTALHIEGHTYTFAKKNLWRCAWAEHFGLDAEADIPAKVDEQVILDKLKELGMRGGTMGCCIKYCLPKDRRSWDKSYSSAPIRKKSVTPTRPAPDRGVQQRLIADAIAEGADQIKVIPIEDWKGADISCLLPDVQTIVFFSMENPKSYESATTDRRVDHAHRMGYHLDKMTFEMAAELEKLGYSGAPYNFWSLKKDPGKAALDALRDFWAPQAPNSGSRFLLTSAKLASFEAKSQYAALGKNLDPKTEIEKLAMELGADVVGFTSAKRVEDAVESVRKDLDGERVLVARETGTLWLSSTAEIQEYNRNLHTPEEHLPGAKSVIVCGIRIPKQSAESLGRYGAEAIGPYSFAQYQSHNHLRTIALKLSRIMQGWGAKAVAVQDLELTGSLVSNPRGGQPNIFCNRISAVCAGLGTITKGGFVNNEEFGTNLRYVAIVTDLELEPSKLPDLQALRSKCEGCDRCIKGCTVKAFKGKTTLVVEGQELPFAIVEQARCDWAIRYGLVADEGQKWTGSKTDIEPPKNITKEALSDAMAKRDPILRIRPCSAEMCAMSCPYTRSQE